MAIPTVVTPGAEQTQQLISKMQKQPKPGSPGFGQVLKQNAAQTTQATAQPNQTHSANATTGVQTTPKTQTVPSAIKSLFKTWSKDQNSMQKVMHVALSGQNFTSSQLILLQNATYKVSFELETMSKLAQETSGAIKTTFQTQV